MSTKPVPADFAERAPAMTAEAMCAHYRVSAPTITRWRKESGVFDRPRPIRAGRKIDDIPAGFAVAAPTMTLKELRVRFRAGEATVRRWLKHTGTECLLDRGYGRDKPAPVKVTVGVQALAARAADECLRRLAPVFRCRADGRADPNGSHWFYGRARTADELVAIAERKGWSADAWKHVA